MVAIFPAIHCFFLKKCPRYNHKFSRCYSFMVSCIFFLSFWLVYHTSVVFPYKHSVLYIIKHHGGGCVDVQTKANSNGSKTAFHQQYKDLDQRISTGAILLPILQRIFDNLNTSFGCHNPVEAGGWTTDIQQIEARDAAKHSII